MDQGFTADHGSALELRAAKAPRMTDQPIVGSSGREFAKVAELSDLRSGEVKLACVGKARIAVCLVEGEVRAVAGRCTHAHAMLAPGHLTAEGLIECPLHGAMFSPIDGSVRCLPATVPLAVHEVRVVDGVVFVDPGPEPDALDNAARVTKPGARPTAAQWGNWK
jgi:3-phenylpropionate/trans-cinnamate dioxygenase ferredoxin component